MRTHSGYGIYVNLLEKGFYCSYTHHNNAPRNSRGVISMAENRNAVGKHTGRLYKAVVQE